MFDAQGAVPPRNIADPSPRSKKRTRHAIDEPNCEEENSSIKDPNCMNKPFSKPGYKRVYPEHMVSNDDGLPQCMCMKCMNFIDKSMKFRQKCMETEVYLLKQLGVLDKNVTGTKCELADAPVKNETVSDDDVKCKVETENDEDMKLVCHTDTLQDDDDEKPLKYLLEPDMENSNDENCYAEYLNRYSLDAGMDPRLDIQLLGKDYTALATNGEAKIIKQKKKTKKETVSDNQQDIELPYQVDLLSKAKTTRVTCKICYQSLSIRSIDTHMSMKHPGKDHRKIQCELCDKYLLKDKMKRHKMMMHGITVQEATCFRCVYCKAEFENKETLVEHVAGCDAKKKKRKINETHREMTECDVCGKSMQKASLRMHKMVKHAGLGPVCEHCGKRFGSKFRLDEHYRAKHEYEKFKCAHCDFTSASLLALRNHERRHRGEKPFVCEACGAKFHAAYLLSQHKQSHRTERLVKCDQCSATFKANNSLHMHKTTCHSASLYSCTMCSRSYSCRHYVVKHLRHFHQYRGAVGPLPRLEKPRRVAEE